MDRPLAELLARRPELRPCESDIRSVFAVLSDSVRDGGTLFLCGNGGSAADAEHWAGELLKGFESRRPLGAAERAGLPGWVADGLQGSIAAVPLTGFVSARTAVANDVDARLEFAQVLHGLARAGDVLIGISTSGRAANVLAACAVARARGVRVVGLTGAGGGELAPLCDAVVRVPATRTLEVQELHLPVYHCLSLMLEEAFFGDCH